MQTFDTPENACPHCGVELNAASLVHGGGGPRPGDATICYRCAVVMVFDDNLNLRPLTPREQEKADNDIYIQGARLAIMQMNQDDPWNQSQN